MQPAHHGADIKTIGRGKRHAHRDFIGFRSGHGEVGHLQLTGHGRGDQLREFDRPGIRVPRGLMNEPARHIADHVDQFGVGVAQRQRHHSGAHVVIGVAIDIE